MSQKNTENNPRVIREAVRIFKKKNPSVNRETERKYTEKSPAI